MACSSGSDPENTSRLGAFQTLSSNVIAGGVTPAASLPTMGTFTYDGLIRLNLPLGATPAEPYIGDMTLSLAFDGGALPVAGSVQNLTAADGAALVGTLGINRGMMRPDADPETEFQFTAAIDGDVTAGGNTYEIDGTLMGDMYGATSEGVAGVVFGDITQGSVEDVFDGVFAGQR